MKFLWKQIFIALLTIGIISGANAAAPEESHKTLTETEAKEHINAMTLDFCSIIVPAAQDLGIKDCTVATCNTQAGLLTCITEIAGTLGPTVEKACKHVQSQLAPLCAKYCTAEWCANQLANDACRVACCPLNSADIKSCLGTIPCDATVMCGGASTTK